MHAWPSACAKGGILRGTWSRKMHSKPLKGMCWFFPEHGPRPRSYEPPVQLLERESMPKKQTYPKYLDGTGDTNASSRVDVMFWVHEVCSQSNGLQAGAHPRKGDQTCKMKAQAWRTSQQTFTCCPKDSLITCLRAWSSTSPSFSINIKLGQKKTSVDPSVSEKKNTCLRPG